MIEGFNEVVKRALHDPREFNKLLNEDAVQLQTEIKGMITDINWQINSGSNRDDPDWKRRATYLKSKLDRHIIEVNAVVKKQNIERNAKENESILGEWRDLAHDLYDFIVENVGTETEVAEWDIPRRESDERGVFTIHEWYSVREDMLARKAAA